MKSTITNEPSQSVGKSGRSSAHLVSDGHKSCIDLLSCFRTTLMPWNMMQYIMKCRTKNGKMMKKWWKMSCRAAGRHVVCRFRNMLPRIHPVHPDLDTSIVAVTQILAPKVVGSWRVHVPGQSKQWWKWWNQHVVGHHVLQACQIHYSSHTPSSMLPFYISCILSSKRGNTSHMHQI